MNAESPLHAKPFIRWAGSKRKLIPTLKQYWPAHAVTYIEPFMGSACLFFELAPQKAILGDMNQDLVNAFRCMKQQPENVHAVLTQLPTDADSYAAIRALDVRSLDKLSRAARFLYLNRFCFNGLYRTNSSGQFNVPYGPKRNGTFPSAQALVTASAALRHAKIRRSDFEDLVWSSTGKGDFVYLDPPFAVSDRRVFTQYGPGTFGLEDLWRLSETLDEIDRRGAHFLLSYAQCREAEALFKKWHRKATLTTRNIAGFSAARRTSVELLYSNIVL